jgi:diguanylate cyclase (GGDEF)-like protein
MESRAVLAARNTEIERQKIKLESMNVELVESSITDALTGLRNRRYLKLFLEELPAIERRSLGFERRADPGSTLTFYLFDLDHFKQVNDQHGHDAGDAVLVEIGHRLRRNLRGGDAALRWGGEELLVIGRGGDEASACAMAARLLDLVGGTPMALPNGKPLRVTCSLGFVSLPWSVAFGSGSALNVDQALSLSDSGLYLAKADGRNRAVGVLPNGNVGVISRLSLLAANPDALRTEDGRGVRLTRISGPTP